jgi:hypothetical protein
MFRGHRSLRCDRVVSLRALGAALASVVESLEDRQLLSAPPNGPYGLTAVATGPTSVEIQFIDNADNETAFKIDRRTPDGQLSAEFQASASAGVGGTVTFEDTTASPLTAYQYTAFAVSPLVSSVAGPANVLTPATGGTTTGNGTTTNPGGPPNGP